jgi:hypothetical protein
MSSLYDTIHDYEEQHIRQIKHPEEYSMFYAKDKGGYVYLKSDKQIMAEQNAWLERHFRFVINDQRVISGILREAINTIEEGNANLKAIETSLDTLLQQKKTQGRWWNFRQVPEESQKLMGDLGNLVGNFYWMLYLAHDLHKASFPVLWHAFFEDMSDSTLRDRSQYLDNWLSRLYTKQDAAIPAPEI